MKSFLNASKKDLFYSILRLAGIVLSAIPLLLLFVTSLIGNIISGQLLTDVLLPAELFFLTFPGMIFITIAAIKQHVHRKLSVVLLSVAIITFALCQVLTLLPGAVSSLQAAENFLFSSTIILLLIFDLTDLTMFVVGLFSIRKLR